MSFSNLAIRTRLGIAFGAAVVLAAVLGALALHSIKAMHTQWKEVERIAMAKRRIATEGFLALGAGVQEFKNYVVRGRDYDRKFLVQMANIDKSVSDYEAIGSLGDDESRALADIRKGTERYRAAMSKIVAMRGEKATVAEMDGAVSGIDRPIGAAFRRMMEISDTSVAGASAEMVTLVETQRKAVVASLVLIVTLVMGIGFLITRSITRPLADALGIADKVAAGDLTGEVRIRGTDEAGQMMRALKKMQEDLLTRITSERVVAAENLRIRNALDKCSTSVMIADREGRIVYLNDSALSLLTQAEAALRFVMPDFLAANLRGASFDQFCALDSFDCDPVRGHDILADLERPYRTEVSAGGGTFVLTATPILDAGERAGTVIEWQDRSNESRAERELAGIVEQAIAGNFTGRIELGGKVGFHLQVGEGVNRLMSLSDTGLNEVARVLGALARGDLTERITGDYAGTFGQLKYDSNLTVRKLNEMVGQIRAATDTINTASREIARGNADLSGRTEAQASSLEETSSSMEELTSTVQHNAENAKKANQLSIGASEVAVRGGNVVGQVVTTMGLIDESSKRIAEIIGVIDGIAFQTNILALNAAVEAARAGEQGRGFAVVATEVRNLAQRSAAAAKEIKALISDSVEKVGTGTRLVDQAGKTMDEVVSSIKRVTDIVAEIAAASQEQRSGIEQVNQAISQMDEATQQNAALVEEAAAAAESLDEQAQMLARAVSAFRTDAMVGDEAAGGDARHGQTATPRNVALLRVSAQRRPAAKHASSSKSAVAIGADVEWVSH